MVISYRKEKRMKSRVTNQCVCCDSNRLEKHPSVLMPFLSDRVFNWSPVEIQDSWDLTRYGIRSGMAYTRCNSLLCSDCGHLFLDIRFNNEEMSRLYKNYRQGDYVELRDKYEPGYRERNETLNSGYNYLQKVEEFLEPFLESSGMTILDWGGDTGKNTPFRTKCEFLHIYEISDKPLVQKAVRITSFEKKNKYDLVVCSHVLEHVPYPKDTLKEIKEVMGDDTLFYIELPYETIIRTEKQKTKRHWHEHINFFNEKSIKKMLTSSGFEVIIIKELCVNEEKQTYVFQTICKKLGVKNGSTR